MARMTYSGDHAAVFVVVDQFTTIEAVNGSPVDVPDAIASTLLDSPVWSEAATDKAGKPGKGKPAKIDDPADLAEEGA